MSRVVEILADHEIIEDPNYQLAPLDTNPRFQLTGK